MESLQLELKDRFDVAEFAFGTNLDNFWIVTTHGAVFKRNKKDFIQITKPRPSSSFEIANIWVSNTGKVYAITRTELLTLE
jgi:hypothetical protein